MNVPISIRNGEPRISISGYTSLFYGRIKPEFPSLFLPARKDYDDDWFYEHEIQYIIKDLKDQDRTEDLSLVEMVLKDLFYNCRDLIRSSKNYMYASTEILPKDRDPEIEDAEIQMIFDELREVPTKLWKTDPFRDLISYGPLKDSYITHTLVPRGPALECNLIFRYQVTGTNHKLRFTYSDKYSAFDEYSEVDPIAQIPRIVEYYNNHFNLPFRTEYSELLHQSILRDLFGFSIDEYFVNASNSLLKSQSWLLDQITVFNPSVFIDKYSVSVPTLDGELVNYKLNKISANNLFRLAQGEFDEDLVNELFNQGFSGWKVPRNNCEINRVTETSIITEVEGDSEVTEDLLHYLILEDNGSLIIKDRETELTQSLVLDTSKLYEIEIGIRLVGEPRNVTLRIGDFEETRSLQLQPTPGDPEVFTMSGSAGIDISNEIPVHDINIRFSELLDKESYSIVEYIMLREYEG